MGNCKGDCLCNSKATNGETGNVSVSGTQSNVVKAFIKPLTCISFYSYLAIGKVYAEIDRVLEPGCLPTFEDRKNMPFTNVVIHEVQRFVTLLPHVPRCMSVNTNFKGYFIPKVCYSLWERIWDLLSDTAYLLSNQCPWEDGLTFESHLAVASSP